MIKFYFIIFLIYIFNNSLSGQQTTIGLNSSHYGIIYLTDIRYAEDPLWLSKIKLNWMATGINLRIFRTSVEHIDSSKVHHFNFSNVDSAVRMISKEGLDIYVRINMCLIDTGWINTIYNDSDFHYRSDGIKYLIPNDKFKRPLLNLTSSNSRGDLLQFVKKTVENFSKYPDSIRKKIKLIVPTISPFDETEYPFYTYDPVTKKSLWGMLTGFSNPEISAFMNYLVSKYHSIENLNNIWGEDANFKSFNENEIKIKEYNWDGIKSEPLSPGYYKFVKGRQDFLDFRRHELKRFIDDCASIIHDKEFKMGIQLGSIYDRNVEFRGFYDPTPVIENIDYLITADIPEYSPNFSFSADYSRSLCKYWAWKKNKEISFATETNWPGYNGHTSETLIKYWSDQSGAFYKKGASALFVSHWGTSDSPDQVPIEIKNNSLDYDYSAWKDTLTSYKNMPIVKVENDYAFQLACEQGIHFRDNETATQTGLPAYIHNNGVLYGSLEQKTVWEFPLCRGIKFHDVNLNNNYYNDVGDIVTTYMLTDSPGYLNANYKRFYLTSTSAFLPFPVDIMIK